MTTQAERIAVLETEAKVIRQDVHKIMKSQEEMRKSQDAMLLELTKYRGLVGGVLLVAGALWAFVQLILPMLFNNKN